jgi:hypothetical protein
LEEGEFHNLLVRLPRTDAAVMGPDGGSRGFWLLPFPLLLDVGVGIVDELANPSPSSWILFVMLSEAAALFWAPSVVMISPTEWLGISFFHSRCLP